MSSSSADIPPKTSYAKEQRRSGIRFGWLDATTGVIAIILAIPVFSVFFSAGVAVDTVFSHLAATVLTDCVLNPALLGVIVGAGVMLLGVPTAWLVAACACPGRRFLEAALVLPLAAPAVRRLWRSYRVGEPFLAPTLSPFFSFSISFWRSIRGMPSVIHLAAGSPFR